MPTRISSASTGAVLLVASSRSFGSSPFQGSASVAPDPLLPTRSLNLPSLRILHVRSLVASFVPHWGDSQPVECPHLSTQSLASVLRLLVSQCPRLEALCIGHGRKYVSRAEVMPPFPRLGTALSDPAIGIASSLVMLHLSDILVDTESVSDILGLSLPRLTFVRFVHCGPDAQAAADALVSQCAALTSDGCVVRAEREMDRALQEQCAPNAPGSIRVRARHLGFPTGDLAGLSLDGVLRVLERGERHNH